MRACALWLHHQHTIVTFAVERTV